MLFENNHHDDPAQRRRHAIYELVYTFIDFLAAILFIIGSILFFFEAWEYVGTWMFLIGSICFALKPTTRVVRDIHLAATGRTNALAEKTNNKAD